MRRRSEKKQKSQPQWLAILFIRYATKPQAFKPGDEWHPLEAKPDVSGGAEQFPACASMPAGQKPWALHFRFPRVLKCLKTIQPANNIAKAVITTYSIFATFSLNT